MRDPYDVLREHLQRTSSTLPASPVPDGLIDGIVGGTITVPGRVRRVPRRRQWIAGGVVAFVVAGGAVGAAAVLREGAPPTRPEAGIVCRASAETTADAIVEPMSDDPIATCAALWSSAALPDPDRADPSSAATPGEVPDLFACIGPTGLVEVFPAVAGAPEGCAAIGLDPADTSGVLEDPAVALGTRVVEQLNATCRSLDETRSLVASWLDELGLDSWQVVVIDQPGECMRGSVESQFHTITIIPIPKDHT